MSNNNTKDDTDKAAAIITMVAQTNIHVGVGQSTGALDLPVARERTTHYPFIPGSGVKGAFRVWAQERAGLAGIRKELFGKEGDEGSDTNAGNLLCSDARLLLLPVRCLSDAYKWVTCPAIFKRFQRDCARAGLKNMDMTIIELKDSGYLGQGELKSWLGLEEREFENKGNIADTVIEMLSDIVPDDDLKKCLVIVSDKDFTWFARYALPVMARNALNEDKIVKAGALWYEESLSPDTIMYLLFGERKSGSVDEISTAINGQSKYIQMGGNETIGQGWFEMKEYEVAQP